MPNWCLNNVIIESDKKTLRKIKQRLRGHDVVFECVAENGGVAFEDHATVFSFYKLIPVPPEIARASYDRKGYDWCCDHWGSKWQAVDPEIVTDTINCLHYRFETAWTPPLPIFHALCNAFPTTKINASYEETGSELVGTVSLEKGIVSHLQVVDLYEIGGDNE